MVRKCPVGETPGDGNGYELTPAQAEVASEDADLLTPDEKAALAAAKEAAAEKAAADAAAAEQAAAEKAAAEKAAAEKAAAVCAGSAPVVRRAQPTASAPSLRHASRVGPACRPHPHPFG